MSTPPIQYSGPTISPEVPWETRRHLQLIYQKLGNHTQAFSLQQQTIAKLKAGATTTVFEGGGGGGGGGSVAAIGVAVNNQSGQTSYSTVSGDNDVLLVFSDASAIAVTLNSQSPPWSCFIANIGALGAGTVTLTPFTGTISYAGNPAASSMPLSPGQSTLVAFDGTNWWALEIAAPGSAGGVSSLDGISGAVTLVAGSNISITDNSPSAGDITIASTAGAGYIKGSIAIGPQGAGGTYTASGTVTGATTGSAVVVGVVNSTEAGIFSNLLGWVTSTDNVTIQVTANAAFLLVNLPVVVFV